VVAGGAAPHVAVALDSREEGLAEGRAFEDDGVVLGS
jgi:hypothetical protein